MSMFKTLQHSPATISLFHNPHVAASARLYKSLFQADAKLNADKPKFIIDLMERRLPTFDQYNILIHNCLRDNYSKHVLKNSYPLLSGSSSTAQGQDRVTTNSPINIGRISSAGNKVFNEGEYNLIYEAFNKIAETQSDDADTSQIFLAPLVVDWDQSMIANDEHGLEQILQKYKH